MPNLDALVVPVGGGGLLAGVAVVIKTLRPEVSVIGVESTHAAGMASALRAGRLVRDPVSPSLADGLAVSEAGQLTFAAAEKWVDDVVTVTEDELAMGLAQLWDREKIAAEGAGVAGLSACLAGKLPSLAGKCVVVPITGCNIDPAAHRQAYQRGRSLVSEQERGT